MKNHVKKNYFGTLITTRVVIFFWLSLIMPIHNYAQSHHSNHTIIITFDNLYPKTWYQKCLDSLLYVWQVLESLHNKTDDEALAFFDSLISKSTFAQFCMKKIKEEQECIIAEDRDYLLFVFKKIKMLMNSIVITEKTKDLVECINFFVESSYQLSTP